MTLCIAALAKVPIIFDPCIVLCFDSKVASEEFASETEHKFHVLTDQLMALVAGRTGRAKELAVIYQDQLAKVQLTQANILDHLRSGLATIKRKLAEAYIQRRLAISYQEFLDHGERWFGQEGAVKYRSDIEKNEFGVDMIFAGFIGNEPIICELRNGDIARVTNFSMIGVGAYSAEPALHARAQSHNTPLGEAVYNVFEAKKIGESSPFVGQETRMYVLRTSNSEKLKISVLDHQGNDFLSEKFKEYGPKPLPASFVVPDDCFTGGQY